MDDGSSRTFTLAFYGETNVQRWKLTDNDDHDDI